MCFGELFCCTRSGDNSTLGCTDKLIRAGLRSDTLRLCRLDSPLRALELLECPGCRIKATLYAPEGLLDTPRCSFCSLRGRNKALLGPAKALKLACGIFKPLSFCAKGDAPDYVQ